MKNILLISLGILLLASIFMGCEEEDEYPFEIKGATIITTQAGFFDFFEITTTTMDFNIDRIGENVSSVEMYKTYNRPDEIIEDTTAASGFDTIPGFSMGPILYTTFTQLPQSVSLTAAEAVDGFGMTVDDIKLGDSFIFTFDKVQTASGTYPSQEVVAANVACPSSLAGEHTFVSTANFNTGVYDPCNATVEGSVIWTATAAGIYSIDDFSFGTYLPCYGGGFPEGDLAVNDVCTEVTLTGVSQFGEVYTWDITEVNGKEMTIVWINDFGEGGTTVLTNGNDKDWPPLFTP